MFRYLAFLLLYLPLGISAQELPDFSANYAVKIKGLQAGELQQHLSTNSDGSRQFISTSQAKGIFAFFKPDLVEESSVWKKVDNYIQPSHYLYQRTGGKKDKYLELDFDWSANKLRINDKKQPWQLDLEPKTLDKLVYQLSLMSDLAADKTQFTYRIADGGKIKTYVIELIAEEVITTQLGKIQTVKLKRIKEEPSNRKTILWCAPSLYFLPVKLQHTEKDGTVFTATLRSLKGISIDEAFIPTISQNPIGFPPK